MVAHLDFLMVPCWNSSQVVKKVTSYSLKDVRMKRIKLFYMSNDGPA